MIKCPVCNRIYEVFLSNQIINDEEVKTKCTKMDCPGYLIDTNKINSNSEEFNNDIQS